MREAEPSSFVEAKRKKDLDLARKALSFHKTWVEILTGEVARLEMGIIPIRNGIRELPKLPPVS